MDRNLELRKDLNQKSFELLKIDVEAALTFTRIATGADHGSDKRVRNQGNALTAYDSIQHLRKNVVVTPEQDQELEDGLERLKSALRKLGEKF